MQDELLEIAVASARSAGRLLLDRFREPASGVGTKSSPTDLVSQVDHDAEEVVRSVIGDARPSDAILGEEHGSSGGTSGLRWIVDPLDGTVNYLFGLPQWCVSLACEDDDGALCAVIHDPLADEAFTATRGGGARLGAEPIAVSDQDDLSQALVATGFSYDADLRREQAELLVRVLPSVRDVRRFGSAALDLAWTASGRFDGYYEAPIGRWDVAAGVLLVREAGGVVSSFGDGVVAAGRPVHDALRSLLTR